MTAYVVASRLSTTVIASLVQPAKDDVDGFLAQTSSATPTRELLEGFFDLNYRHRHIFIDTSSSPWSATPQGSAAWMQRDG